MKIGFDAKWFFSGNPSGQVVVRNILGKLINTFPQHEFYIFLRNKDRKREFPFKGKNLHLIYVIGSPNILCNLVFIPIQTLFLNLDIALFQYYSPLFTTYKRIAFIYDVIFLDHPEFFTWKERIYFWPIKYFAKRAHRICTISYSEKNRLISHGFGPESKIDVIHIGVNNNFKIKAENNSVLLNKIINEYKLPERFLLYIGRINERKNIPNLLKSILHLKDTSIKLVLGGSYDWKISNIDELINSMKISERVIKTGFIPQDYLGPLYSLSTVFCYVSYDEGFGLPPLEAMACGIPVVAAKRASLPEICGDAAIFVDPDDPKSIAQGIDTLLLEDNYEDKKVKAMKRACLFTWDNTVKKLMNSFRATINQEKA